METKRCTKCGEVKLLAFFRFHSSHNCYEGVCKKCIGEYNRLWRLDNSQKCKQYRKTWRNNNKDYRVAHQNIRKSGLRISDISKSFFENEIMLVALRRKLRQLKEAQGG